MKLAGSTLPQLPHCFSMLKVGKFGVGSKEGIDDGPGIEAGPGMDDEGIADPMAGEPKAPGGGPDEGVEDGP